MSVMLLAVAIVATQATLAPLWTAEYFPERSGERIVYATFLSEKEILYASNYGLLQRVSAENGKVIGTSRVGLELQSGVRVGHDLWFKTAQASLVRVPLKTPERQSMLTLGSPWTYAVSDGSPFALTSEGTEPIRVIRLQDGETVATIKRDATHSGWYGAGSHKTGKVAIVASQTLTVWDVRSGKSERRTRLPLGDLTDIRFTPDDRQIAITYKDWLGTVFYDAQSFKRIIGIKGTQFVSTFAPTLRAMANSGHWSGYRGRRPGIWDVTDGYTWSLDREDPATCAAFSPSSRRVVFAWRKSLSVYAVPARISKRWSSG